MKKFSAINFMSFPRAFTGNPDINHGCPIKTFGHGNVVNEL